MSDMLKSPDIEGKTTSDDGPERAQSITTDDRGDTIITSEHGETFIIDKAAERRLLWKFDLRILPLLTMMYLFNALDKANLGNAKTDGLEKDLGFAGTNKCEHLPLVLRLWCLTVACARQHPALHLLRPVRSHRAVPWYRREDLRSLTCTPLNDGDVWQHDAPHCRSAELGRPHGVALVPWDVCRFTHTSMLSDSAVGLEDVCTDVLLGISLLPASNLLPDTILSPR